MISSLHSSSVFPRRVRVLIERVGGLIPAHSRVLDVGTGDGSIAAAIQKSKPGLAITGIDVLVRPQTAIPVAAFDGTTIPHAANSHDVVMFVDVLHHTPDPQVLLNEAARVTKQYVVIKDHNRNGFLAGPTLRFMDWVGNAHHGVALPYNYWSREQWAEGFRKAGLEVVSNQTKIDLYPGWADWLFGRGLHCVVLLQKKTA